MDLYNTDGASRENPRLSSYAFCLRDDNGDLLHAEGDGLANSSNTVAEPKAILEASKHCSRELLNKVIIQTDSLLLCKILQEEWTSPWEIAELVTEIKLCMHQKEHVYQHIMREGNQLADHLANKAMNNGRFIINDFYNLDTKSRKIINSDKLSTPYIRVSLSK